MTDAQIAELPRRYEPVLREREHVLLRRRAAQPAPGELDLTPLLDIDVRVGEELDLPGARTHALWLQVDVGSSALGRVRNALYKPPPLFITVMPDVGGPETWRLIPGIARSGFIIQPTITTFAELDAFLEGHGRRWARAIRLDAVPGQREYWGDMHVRISQLANLSLSTEAEAASTMDGR